MKARVRRSADRRDATPANFSVFGLRTDVQLSIVDPATGCGAGFFGSFFRFNPAMFVIADNLLEP